MVVYPLNVEWVKTVFEIPNGLHKSINPGSNNESHGDGDGNKKKQQILQVQRAFL